MGLVRRLVLGQVSSSDLSLALDLDAKAKRIPCIMHRYALYDQAND